MLLVAVMNPTEPSLRGGRRIVALSRELPVKIDRRAVLVNRVGPLEMLAGIDREVAAWGVERLADVPQDDEVEPAGPPARRFHFLCARQALAAVRNVMKTFCAAAVAVQPN